MKKIFFAVYCSLFFSISLSAQNGIDFSGVLETNWALAAPWTDNESYAGRFLAGDTSFTGKVDAYYGNSSAFGQLSINYDSLESDIDFSLDELWIDYTDSFWGIRIGRQKIVWGKSDGIDITNVICPSDFSNLSSLIKGDSKLAVDAVCLSLNKNNFSSDFLWIPFFTPALLPVSPEVLEKPEYAIWNSEYGIRCSFYLSALDISLYGFYGWDDNPFLDYSLTFEVSGNYKRMGMAGIDAALPVGPVVFRMETAVFPLRHFQKKAETIITEKSISGTSTSTSQHNEFSALAGIDWMPEGWTITAQYYLDYVNGNLENIERENSFSHGATVSLSKNLLHDTIEISFSGILEFDCFDSLLNPSIKYSLSDQITLNAGAIIFLPGPQKEGSYGKYKDLSSFILNARFSF